MHPKQKCIESSLVFVSRPRGTSSHKTLASTSCLALCCTFIIPVCQKHVLQASRWMFAECVNLVYICQELLVAHLFEADLAQRVFLFTRFCVISLCSSPCSLFPIFASLFLWKKEAPLRASFSVQHLFIPFTAQFLYSHNISLSPHFQSTAQPPCPSLACPAADLAFVG